VPNLQPSATSHCLLVFVKNALKGQVKSRLAESIGNSAALAVYNELLLRVRNILHEEDYDKFIFYSEYIERTDVFENDRFKKRIQKGNDLGERMNHAFNTAFDLNYEKVVLIGSDIPKLSEKIVLDAFQALDSVDLVIGPAKDGGYYLLGMKKNISELFYKIFWGTEEVFRQTIRRAHKLNLKVRELPVLEDLDTMEDIAEMDEKERELFNTIIRKTSSNYGTASN
jgi:rSAM/selenodomain-associated transferase 1